MMSESLDRIVKKTGRDRNAALAALLAPDAQERLISPAEVADAVLRLCAPASNAVTGESVPLYGRA